MNIKASLLLGGKDNHVNMILSHTSQKTTMLSPMLRVCLIKNSSRIVILIQSRVHLLIIKKWLTIHFFKCCSKVSGVGKANKSIALGLASPLISDNLEIMEYINLRSFHFKSIWKGQADKRRKETDWADP